MNYVQNNPSYQPLAKDEEGEGSPAADGPARFSSSNRLRQLAIIGFIAIGSFISGLAVKFGMGKCGCGEGTDGIAPRIPAQGITGEFVYSSPFSKEPPKEEDMSEPVWDALIPNGLGYFRDDNLAPKISIPTVFHQIHCLYILRRAYYSHSDKLEAFDFGKNRSHHASHCFDYLEQSITCASDSTVEPGEDDPNGFLGSGFPRQCRDFEAVKSYVEKWRVFNATGFLAHGLDHGKAHID